jgi:hypothetical protein
MIFPVNISHSTILSTSKGSLNKAMAKIIGLSQSFNARKINKKNAIVLPHPTTAPEPTKRIVSQKMILL